MPVRIKSFAKTIYSETTLNHILTSIKNRNCKISWNTISVLKFKFHLHNHIPLQCVIYL